MQIDQRQFLAAIEQISEEKGISREQILETIEAAIAAAYKKEHNLKGHKVVARFNIETGVTKLFEEKEVVEDMTESELEEQQELLRIRKEERATSPPVEETEDEEDQIHIFNSNKEIMLTEAEKIKKSAKVGAVLTFPLEADGDYGRIAAQTAKQVIIQKIRETEREAVYNELKSKEETVVSGTVQRIENGTIFFELGRATGILTHQEQIPHEQYRAGSRLRVYVLKVEKSLRGPAILLSRTRPEIIQKLFELEVPEISDGSVEIKAISREPGSRSKVAVVSHEDEIDPIGACVGQKGTRVSTIINELGGENIDIVLWDESTEKFIANALSPAKVITVELKETKKVHADGRSEKLASIKVAADQLSLAIGRNGQNVRLAAKLTGWKIDVFSEEDRKNTDELVEEKKDEEVKKNPPANGEKKPKKKVVKKDSKNKKTTKASAETNKTKVKAVKKTKKDTQEARADGKSKKLKKVKEVKADAKTKKATSTKSKTNAKKKKEDR